MIMNNVYTRNYNRLVKLGIINDKGELQFKDAISLESKPYMNLNLDDLGNHTIAMAHNFEQNGDIMADPDMQIRIVPEIRMIEALTYQLDSMGIYQVVYPEPNKVNPRAKKELNAFLEKWLINLIQQRFKLIKNDQCIEAVLCKSCGEAVISDIIGFKAQNCTQCEQYNEECRGASETITMCKGCCQDDFMIDHNAHKRPAVPVPLLYQEDREESDLP